MEGWVNCAQCLGQGNGMLCAHNVGHVLALGVRLQVINSGQMEEVVNFSCVLLDPCRLDPELRTAQIPFDRDNAP